MSKNADQVLHLLRSGSMIHHYMFGNPIIVDDFCDEVGELSQRTFNKLLEADMIIHAAESSFYWSLGYFKLKKTDL